SQLCAFLPSAPTWECRRSSDALSKRTSRNTHRVPARSEADMGTRYARGKMLWIGYIDEHGQQVCRSSGHRVGQEALADALLAQLEQLAQEKRSPVVVTGTAASAAVDKPRPGPVADAAGPTVIEYGTTWITRRRGVIDSADVEEGRLKNHVYPR